jgi:hypothetical protein
MSSSMPKVWETPPFWATAAFDVVVLLTDTGVIHTGHPIPGAVIKTAAFVVAGIATAIYTRSWHALFQALSQADAAKQMQAAEHAHEAALQKPAPAVPETPAVAAQ